MVPVGCLWFVRCAFGGCWCVSVVVAVAARCVAALVACVAGPVFYVVRRLSLVGVLLLLLRFTSGGTGVLFILFCCVFVVWFDLVIVLRISIINRK